MKSTNSNDLLNLLILRIRVIIAAGLLLAVMPACSNTSGSGNSQVDSGTLPGADEIYPTVMVNGECYEWRRGVALLQADEETFINSRDYYGDITKVEGKSPENDCEIVCVFDAAGTIYTDPKNKDVIYLKLTTDWLDDKVVIFDKIK